MIRARWQLVASALPLLLWLVSLADALHFHADARDHVAQSGSLDADRDLRYAVFLLAATAFGTTLALLQASAWLRRHRAMWSLGALVVGGFGVAFHRCVAIGPIVHFASGFNVTLLWFVVGGLYAATLLVYGIAHGLARCAAADSRLRTTLRHPSRLPSFFAVRGP